MGLLESDRDEPAYPADAVVNTGPPQCGTHFPDCAIRKHRHVAREIRYRRCQPSSRLSTFDVGHVHSNILGLGDATGIYRIVCHLILAVFPPASAYIDFRDERDPS